MKSPKFLGQKTRIVSRKQHKRKSGLRVPAFYLNADTDPVFTLIRIRIRIRILLLIKVMGIFDHWSIGPPGLHLSLKASVVFVYGPPRLYFEPLTYMRIRIQLFTIMRIRIQLPKLRRLWISNPGRNAFFSKYLLPQREDPDVAENSAPLLGFTALRSGSLLKSN
jgi:hypothetical protein